MGFPSGTDVSRANDINGSRITGWFNVAGDSFGLLGFMRDGDNFNTIFPLAGGTSVESYRVNSSGAVVGGWGNTGTGPFPLAFRWQKGVLQNIDEDMTLPGESIAYDITDSGLITGWMGTYVQGLPHYHAFIWNNGRVTDLGLGNLPDCFATEGHAINNKGHVCGIWWRPSATYPYWDRRGFFYDGQTMIDLGSLPFWPEFFAMDLNDSDQIVGYAATHNGGAAGCLWQNGKLYQLMTLVPLTAES